MKPALHLLVLLSLGTVAQAESVQLARDTALSPDGATLAFAWRGDLWTVPVEGGRARRLTQHSAEESQPVFSPDGKRLAFISTRDAGTRQVFVMPARGGDARQLTRHSEGHDLLAWMPDSDQLLLAINRDHSWMRGARASRLALLDLRGGLAPATLFDDYAYEPSVSADGQRLLFIREGEAWWRQGYQGSRAGQIWLFDRAQSSFKQLKAEPAECRWPLWLPDGSGYYHVSNRDGTFNLWHHDLASAKDRQITRFQGDSVVFPSLSRDGRTLVFRHRFDLYRWQPGSKKEPEKIDIRAFPDDAPATIDRPLLTSATEAAHTRDGLQIAFIAGGDVWVMDTELREPRRVTTTAEEERGLTFAPDGKSLWFVSDTGGQTDIWKATPAEAAKPWWQNATFTLTRITDDPAAESRLRFTPDGKKLAYVKERGDLWLAEADGSKPRRLFTHWDAPSYDFSPDSLWIVYAQNDEWFNSDIWLLPLDGSRPAFNLSRHPDNDHAPVWSPDGKKIAWTGRRDNDEIDIHYVWLRAEDDEQSKRERTLIKALAKFKKPDPPAEPTPANPPGAPTPTDQPAQSPTPTQPPPTQPPTKTPAPPTKNQEPATKNQEPGTKNKTTIDFDAIHERVHRVAIPNTSESALAWSPDSKKLAFSATVDGRRGTYTIEPPDDSKPKLLSSTTLSAPVWLKEGDQITGLTPEGRPASLSAKGSLTTRPFTARHSIDRPAKQRAVFDQCWQVMRDHYYDDRLGNRDWDAVREKYSPAAATAADWRSVQDLVHLMLGELNGSHLGFILNDTLTGAPAPSSRHWKEETAHLGLRFDPAHTGPGWKVRDVIFKGPATRKASRIQRGEIVLRIDGLPVHPRTDPAAVLRGPLERDISLRVRAADGKERDVTLRPISYADARSLLYRQWIEENRARVEELSGGTLGYLHISAMDDASFHQFQADLYAAGAGRDGLVIDVRENGGGSTTDHLLTALTQPRHAIAIPRGGSVPGYPQDRTVYATWEKPVTVLCNQNSYSNAEIFSHAVKLLGRGQLVGVPTAGGVISTGRAGIMDIGSLRLPYRGWYGLQSGIDMELNGAVPDHLLWPQPGELATGLDRQLDKAIEVLQKDVTAWQARPQPKLQKASERLPTRFPPANNAPAQPSN